MASTEGRKKRFWIDPRFAIGLGLIVISVAGMAFVIRAADSSVSVLAARSALTPGEKIDSRDFITVQVAMAKATSTYLAPSEVPAGGFVVTRTVGAGELVPASAVGSVEGVDSTSLVISVKGQLAGAIVAGATADVWSAPKSDEGFGAPIVIVPAATIVRLVKSSGMVVNEASGSVEVLVPKVTVARLLQAIANQDALSLVPASLPSRD